MITTSLQSYEKKNLIQKNGRRKRRPSKWIGNYYLYRNRFIDRLGVFSNSVGRNWISSIRS